MPWFVISKEELLEDNGKTIKSVKHRLITDCRQVNKFLSCPHFRMDHWGQIFPFLRKGQWASKIDLKHAYFHLPLGKNLQQYLVMQVGEQLFQFTAAPFGLNILPFLWTKVMKVLSRIWRKKGILVFVYLDDLLVIAKTPLTLKRDLQTVLKTLENAGMVINYKKSILVPSQQIHHLGFLLDLQTGHLMVPSEK